MTTLVTSTGDELLARVNEIAPTIREHAAEAEQARCVSRPVVDAMLKAGLFAMARPSAFGGLELDPVVGYCNGGWDVELWARYAVEAPMLRP